jgi:TonB family protein
MSTIAPMMKAIPSTSWSWAFSTSLVVSVGAHFALFALNPQLGTGNLDVVTSELQMVDMLPPDIVIPPPPEVIARPATPVVASARVDENITIAPTTFEANPVYTLPPPPAAAAEADADIKAAPRFTPYTVKPELKNVDVIRQMLERNYPALLRDAGIGGTVLLWVFIDQEGVVQRTLVKNTSGYVAFDEAALNVAPEMKFTPALNRDLRVPVWLEIPLIFHTR